MVEILLIYIAGFISAGLYMDFELRDENFEEQHPEHMQMVIFTALTWPVTWINYIYRKPLTPITKTHDKTTEERK